MDYKFCCGYCGQPISVSDEFWGTKADCPSCSRELTVPNPSVAEVQRQQNNTPQEPFLEKTRRKLSRMIEVGRRSGIGSDFREIDFKTEVMPFNAQNISILKSDFVFWVVAFLAIVPLFLVTLKNTDQQLTGFCLFFAAVWGLILKRFVVEETGGWGIPLVSLFFTGIIGLKILLWVQGFFPTWYRDWPESIGAFRRLAGYVFTVGFWEEICKILPVLLYLSWKRRQARPLTIVVVGVFSGLGFGAFENLGYADLQVDRSFRLARSFGIDGLEEGVRGAMINVMLRSMSTVFGHAVYSGIFAYFIAVGWLGEKRRMALASVGIGVSSVVHGFYNWFWEVQATLPALTTAFGFMLFYCYLTKLKLLIKHCSQDEVADDDSKSQS